VDLDALQRSIADLVNLHLEPQDVKHDDVTITQLNERTLKVEIVLAVEAERLADVVKSAKFQGLAGSDTDLTFVEKLAVDAGLPVDAISMPEPPVIVLFVPPSSPPSMPVAPPPPKDTPSTPVAPPPARIPDRNTLIERNEAVRTAELDDGGIAGIAVGAFFVIVFGICFLIYLKARRRHLPMKSVVAGMAPGGLGKRHNRETNPLDAAAAKAAENSALQSPAKVTAQLSDKTQPNTLEKNTSEATASNTDVQLVLPAERERGSASTPERSLP